MLKPVWQLTSPHLIALINGLLLWGAIKSQMDNECKAEIRPTNVSIPLNESKGLPLFEIISTSIVTSVLFSPENVPIIFDLVTRRLVYTGNGKSPEIFLFRLVVYCLSTIYTPNYDFILRLIDIIDRAPIWINGNNYSATILDSAPINSQLQFATNKPIVQAKPAEIETFCVYLLTSNLSDYFELTSPADFNSNPQIKLVKVGLDYDVMRTIHLQLLVENGVPNTKCPVKRIFSSIAFIEVSILDGDSKPPIFKYNQYSATLFVSRFSSNSFVSVLPENISAVDGDKFRNAVINFEILRQFPSENSFSINKQSGLVFINGSNFPSVQTQTIIIIASQLNDSSSQNAVVPLQISILRTDPRCRSDIEINSVNENLPSGTLLLSNILVVSDKPDSIKYSLLNFLTSLELRCNQTNFSCNLFLRSEQFLDREILGPSITIWFQATDTSNQIFLNVTQSTNCSLLLPIKDLNEFSPKFTSDFPTTVRVARAKNTFVIRIKAYDNDSTAILTFSLKSFENLLEINPVFGDIILKAEPAQLTEKNYLVLVSVSDGQFSSQSGFNLTFVESLSEASFPVWAIILICLFVLIIIVVLLLLAAYLYWRHYKKSKIPSAPSQFGESTYSFTDAWASNLQLPEYQPDILRDDWPKKEYKFVLDLNATDQDFVKNKFTDYQASFSPPNQSLHSDESSESIYDVHRY